jgi:hypothetical protein
MPKRQRPTAIYLRLRGRIFERFENFRRSQPVIPDRSAAARELLERGLSDQDEPARAEPAT